jgi:hypothetical protein
LRSLEGDLSSVKGMNVKARGPCYATLSVAAFPSVKTLIASWNLASSDDCQQAT